MDSLLRRGSVQAALQRLQEEAQEATDAEQDREIEEHAHLIALPASLAGLATHDRGGGLLPARSCCAWRAAAGCRYLARAQAAAAGAPICALLVTYRFVSLLVCNVFARVPRGGRNEPLRLVSSLVWRPVRCSSSRRCCGILNQV